MRLIKGFIMSIGMYTVIPAPAGSWDERYADLMLPCFPLTGIFVGGSWCLSALFIKACGINLLLKAAVVAFIPYILTGFLHLDGYMDTSDAILSRRSKEEKQRILKDPHAGAFSVIMLVFLFLLQFACMYAVICEDKALFMLLPVCVVSRCCSAMCLFRLEPLPASGYARMYRKNIKPAHKAFVAFTGAVMFAITFFAAGIYGIVILTAALLGYALAMLWAYRSLGGVSGDLAGFALVIGELSGIFALAVI